MKQFSKSTIPFLWDSLLNMWVFHNKEVLENVPEDRLLILKTNELSRCRIELANWLKIPVNSLGQQNNHIFKAKNDFRVVFDIDRSYLEQKVAEKCSNLMEQFFPGIVTLNDAVDAGML